MSRQSRSKRHIRPDKRFLECESGKTASGLPPNLSIIPNTMLRKAVILSAWLLCSALVAFAADPEPEPLKVPPRLLEEFKLPPGTVIVVRGDPREALG